MRLIRRMKKLPIRKKLPHGIPSWASPGDIWFITICCRNRGVNTLAKPALNRAVRETLLVREKLGQLKLIRYVIMPDHLHLVLRFNHTIGIRRIVSGMKGYLAKQGGIGWQKGFFDHRIRSDKLLRETLDYVRLNPVRAKLVEKSEDWPHQWPG